MKTIKNTIITSAIYAIVLFAFFSCKKNEEAPNPAISDFIPTSAVVGTSITINGSNFNSNPSANTVKFNGIAATVTSSTSSSITTTVPNGATSGVISISVNGKTALSSANFMVIPTLAGFSPTQGIIGTSVTISGSNFDTSPDNNIVKFNGVAATVTNASTTSLTVTVPPGATTGKISVLVNGNTFTSAEDFNVLDLSITSFSPDSGVAGTPVTISGHGFDIDTEVKFNELQQM